MIVSFNSHLLKLTAEALCCFLACVMGNYNASYHKAAILKLIAKT